MNEPAVTFRRRRAVAAAGLAALLALAALAARSCGSDDRERDAAVVTAPAPLRAQLPRGGRRIFPDHRVVAFYGAPQHERLGILGIGTPARAAARLERVARAYERRTRPVLPAFELIATIANAHPGTDGLYRTRQQPEVIERYLLGARRAKALLVLDIQPGRAGFLEEARQLEQWLVHPDVGLALDPEWHVGAGEVPGRTLGRVTARQVNAVARWLSDLVVARDLPEKLFVVHQFTNDMIAGKDRVARPPGLAVTMNVDGFGGRAVKIAKYEAFTSERVRFHDGFKLFYEEDTNLMSPAGVLALKPPPDLVVYE